MSDYAEKAAGTLGAAFIMYCIRTRRWVLLIIFVAVILAISGAATLYLHLTKEEERSYDHDR